MRIIVLTLTLASVLLTACSPQENYTEGCWVAYVNETKLNPPVPLPTGGESLALSPGDSVGVWCAREINDSSLGAIIDEAQQTIRIDAMPQDAELRVYPNERDAVYLGRTVASSGDVWQALQEASSTADRRRLISQIEGAALAACVVAIAVLAIVVWRWSDKSSSGGQSENEELF